MAKKKALNIRSESESSHSRPGAVVTQPRGLDAAEGEEDIVDEAIRHREEARASDEHERQERARKKAA